MNNEEVAHLWAHQVRESARGSHFYFEGDTIYSYGPHFPIARHITNKRGQKAILFTTEGRSQSTSAHKNLVSAAIAGGPVFHVQNPHNDPNPAMFREFEARAFELVSEARKPRKTESVKARLIGEAKKAISKAAAFAEFFGFAYTAPDDVLKLADEWQARIEAAKKA